MKKATFSLIFLFILAGCVKDRDFLKTLTPGNSKNPEIIPGILKINEIDARGTILANEFGSFEDWFEIFNSTSDTIFIQSGKWFVTDDATGNPRKFGLPDTFILPKGFLLIFCDDQNTTVTEIHTNFKLSSSGEHLGIFYEKDGENLTIDSYLFPPQIVNGRTHGRFPDGGENWVNFNTPTPGQANIQ